MRFLDNRGAFFVGAEASLLRRTARILVRAQEGL